MATAKYPLSKLTHELGKHVIDSDSGLEVFDAPNSHVLIQAAGYLKYTLAKSDGLGVFFRGQTRLYTELTPSLLRGVKDGPPTVKRRELLNEFLQDLSARDLGVGSVPEQAREAMLQHYGIRTTWLDVVDNIWIALWFACHHARSTTWPNEYMHFERRVPEGPKDYVYVLLLASAYGDPVPGEPGHYRDDRSETIDLRVAAPSHFLRPHAQHGVLVRRLSKAGLPVSDNRPLHVGTIRVKLSLALDWLGTATTLTSHSLFPPALYDFGYRLLLQDIQTKHKNLGSIHRIQP